MGGEEERSMAVEQGIARLLLPSEHTLAIERTVVRTGCGPWGFLFLLGVVSTDMV
jgi:hypothetical protein